ncbi:GNAT family N-acetyltransferase [Hymenobacter algoricola]|uniref:N-acetyltransferase domain-containing protein n=1 Tax=Hymenobacter algoricola TaxID=486267 RepID=A0ABP7NPD2_9BACT
MKQALERLSWDSDFLGYPVARIQPAATDEGTVQALVSEARAHGYRLLYWSTDPTDAQAAATAQYLGARLADQKVTFAMAVPAASSYLPAGVEPTTELTPKLESLARQAGHQSRYQTDPNFAPDVYEHLYDLWIANSVQGTLAREVLVFRAEPGAEEAGLITLGIKKGRVDIGLLAVDEQVRGQTIGAKLVEAARQRTRAWGYDTLQVVTQLTNVGACRFYERCGFTINQLEYIYHVWLE